MLSMIHLLILAVHLLATIAKLLRPGGVRAVVAESMLLRHQLIISSRARRRAPNLNSFDRLRVTANHSNCRRLWPRTRNANSCSNAIVGTTNRSIDAIP